MAFWKPGTLAPGSAIDRATERSAAPTITSSLVHNTSLPILAHRRSLLHAIERFPVTIVVGETGCGKSTQLPQMLERAGWATGGRRIGCTQPRRVAVTSLAGRVAAEMGCVLGNEVGYTVRFEDLSSPSRTRIKCGSKMVLALLAIETLTLPFQILPMAFCSVKFYLTPC
ncbi:hypothetical protein CROQUDRAFT_359543 [Cronartium quercuum f. sp. fusiforme G11]|uniref:ATP-dependent RNA helicase n=1 Tax=Cronartium quercuum f. sp. fusiforme G11 TaxID=708437 RepID=A0A9P6NRH0_9BASI|nr:hypothetical protein CROQUDRAFT_359543 [Cronartium quercuum f. sp. fusiforme G11]